MLTDFNVCRDKPKNELIRVCIRIGGILVCLLTILSVLMTGWLIFFSGDHITVTWRALWGLLFFCFSLFLGNSFICFSTGILREFPCYPDETELDRRFYRLVCSSFISFWIILLPSLFLGWGVFENLGGFRRLWILFLGMIMSWGFPWLLYQVFDYWSTLCISKSLVLFETSFPKKTSESFEPEEVLEEQKNDISDPSEEIQEINRHLFESLDSILAEHNRNDYYDVPDDELNDDPSFQLETKENCLPDEFLLHQQNRIRGKNGQERIEGQINIQLSEKENHRTIYIGFCPPFQGVPMFYCEPADECDWQTGVTKIQPFGVRLEIKRKQTSLSETVQYIYYAALED